MLEQCEVLLARTVIDVEVKYYHGAHSDKQIDLTPYVVGKQVQVVDVPPSEVAKFRNRFNPTYQERLDPGETESLAYLVSATDTCSICSSDAIVYRVLACLGREDQGISLERLLQQIGLGRPLPEQFREQTRVKWTKQGQEDAIRGVALRK